MNRLDAIRDVRNGMGISRRFFGRFTTFSVIIRRDPEKKGRAKAILECPVMRKTYEIKLSTRQVLTYIRLWYPREEMEWYP